MDYHEAQRGQQQQLDLATELRQTVKQIQNPGTKIHFSALLPKVSPRFNKGLNIVNSIMYSFCHQNDIGFIQHSRFCTLGRLTKDFYAPSEWRKFSALHPSEEGSKYMSDNYKNHLLANQ